MISKDESFKKISELIERYNKDKEYHNSNSYKEYELRLSFIDVFFQALGWDVAGQKAKSSDQRDVIVEKSIDDNETKKFVDYTFRINKINQFIVEAKKPFESLDNKKHIFQTKSYGFSMGIPFVILTNFKRIKVFDISAKPLIDHPDMDLVIDLNMNEYINKFNDIWDLFNREAVKNKSLVRLYLDRRNLEEKEEIKFDSNYANIKGSSLLNKAFLDDLLSWRNLLAENIYTNNNHLNVFDINEIVQRTLDRIIFLRILEDRGIENKEILRKAIHRLEHKQIDNLKDYLNQIYVELNDTYNGLLFCDHELSTKVIIDNSVLEYIIKHLYFPSSPYNFKQIDVEILGKIFEQYLGSTIIIENNQVKISLKNEVRKAGGVYYTPSEIVDEIIDNTLRKELENKNLEAVSEISVLDISCGSGSFLIKAYREIMDYYIGVYASNQALETQALKDDMIFIEDKQIYLTMKAKNQILQNNIYGVDIDPQAVEVSKMSLYITMLEENYKDKTIKPILPDLNNNIASGNSIIELDYYDEYDEYDEIKDLHYRPFNWKSKFRTIMKRGGFDCIIGNPPYIKIHRRLQNTTTRVNTGHFLYKKI